MTRTSTPDLNEHPHPYVLRIPPRPDEGWPSYLRRVATTYNVTPSDIVAPISKRWATRLTRDPSPTTAGIAMSEPTTTATGRLLNLDPAEIQAMQLTAHDGTALTFTTGDTARYDPVFGPGRWEEAHRLGWLNWRLTPRQCAFCPSGDAHTDTLFARYVWWVVCPSHDYSLVAGPPDWADTAATTRQLEAAARGERVFERTDTRNGFAEFRAVYSLLRHILGEIHDAAHQDFWPDEAVERVPDVVRRIQLPYHPESQEFRAHTLPLALHCSQTPLQEWPPQLTSVLLDETERPGQNSAASYRQAFTWRLEMAGSTSPFGLRSDLANVQTEPFYATHTPGRELTIPSDCTMLTNANMAACARDTFTAELPPRLAVPTLSDYTPFLTIDESCRVGALAAYMHATGDTFFDACVALRVRSIRQRAFRQAWWHLESVGTLGDYLDNVARIIRQLLTERRVDTSLAEGRRHPGATQPPARVAAQ